MNANAGTVSIVGAGLMGRVLALNLAQRGFEVSLFEKDGPEVLNSCGYAGAGMLSPISELESAEPLVAALGFDSLPLWRTLIERLDLPVFFQQTGTLIVAHHLDVAELARFTSTVQTKLRQCQQDEVPASTQAAIQWQLNAQQIAAQEPQLQGRFQHGVLIPEEGQLDNRSLLTALEHQLNRLNVQFHFHTAIDRIQPNTIHDGQKTRPFDWVMDCRGLGGKADWQALRGVRGEIIRVHAPEVTLNRPVRLMHPRYPLYIAPRENHQFVIGATSIESADFRPMTVQSALELLSAAFTVHPGFAEASILDMTVNCRPALPDNVPKIYAESGLLRINGLYRHGFLIAPMLAELAATLIQGQGIPARYQAMIQTSQKSRVLSFNTESETRYAVAY